VLPAVLLGCGGPAADRPAPRPTTPAPAPPSPTPGSDVKACFDGDCLLTVTRPIKIPLDAKRYYYPVFAITAVTPDRIGYRVDYPNGGHAEQWLGQGGSSSFGSRSHTQVNVRLVSITRGRAVLAISPGPRH
jgi:hypothetical protein